MLVSAIYYLRSPLIKHALKRGGGSFKSQCDLSSEEEVGVCQVEGSRTFQSKEQGRMGTTIAGPVLGTSHRAEAERATSLFLLSRASGQPELSGWKGGRKATGTHWS